MIVTSAKAAEIKVYWINARGLTEARLNGLSDGLGKADWTARMEALASGIFSNSLLTRAAKNALVVNSVQGGIVLPFPFRRDFLEGSKGLG